MNKLTKKDKQKIVARYYTKLEEFKLKSLEELKTLYNSKISHTDKQAVLAATEYLMSQQEIELTLPETTENGSTNTKVTQEQQEV